MPGDIGFRIYERFLTYPAGQEIHTAASGRMAGLSELFLEITDKSTGHSGHGEVRTNIEFITGTPSEQVLPGVIALLGNCGTSTLAEFESSFSEKRWAYPKICQALIENALVDLQAKLADMPIAQFLGGAWKEGVPCNQCVFWGNEASLRANSEHYIREGFKKIKVRVGIGSIEEDEARISWLRHRFGENIDLDIDANGAWDADHALKCIDRLRKFRLGYVEQPTPPGNWADLERVARECGMMVVIDEGLRSEADVDTLCSLNGLISAHLKIAKAGGVAEMVRIARRLDNSTTSYVVGQMNEGALATAVAVQAAMAVRPMFGELYGAMGVQNDPADGVKYGSGVVSVPRGPGVAISVRHQDEDLRWQGGAN
ncbi:MAG: mandelate racemase/muconate lactonizing enzyme family protein [Rhizobiaceae bacterium]|nr:mandelate racemase/muconate lactonizing enzyme family protein [Rhizobiaceae bacterium]